MFHDIDTQSEFDKAGGCKLTLRTRPQTSWVTNPRRRSSLLAIFALATLAFLPGCRLCCDTEDIAYPAYGGAWQRTIRDHGRVGSIFDPGGNKASLLVDRSAPLNADELERLRSDGIDIRDLEEGPEQPAPDGEILDPSESRPKLPEVLEDIEESDREKKLRDMELDEIEVRMWEDDVQQQASI
ncbi:MAG: hypothetical protein AAF664_09145 [Planctomycetota bacterium]